MGCGTAVVATDVWGTAEVVAASEAGVLIRERSGPAVAAGLRTLFDSMPDCEATRRYAERFSWDATTDGQLALFRRLTGSGEQVGYRMVESDGKDRLLAVDE
jgi:glycosyltransferase involved in cell wall biosynthesis